MARTPHHPILGYLRQVLGTAANGSLTDADLLERFVNRRDEAAFELLLWRHATMVLSVCRHVLHDADAAEDAFQATFLVFVRKAGAISRRESLGGWLYRVAYRTALKARQAVAASGSLAGEQAGRLSPRAVAASGSLAGEQAGRLSPRAVAASGSLAGEQAGRLSPRKDGADEAAEREMRRLVCEEVDRLPAKYRTAVVACYFEGKSHEEAAHQLGWPLGTVAGRLARARELLRRRLVRRGVTLSAVMLIAGLSAEAAQAAAAGLIDTTIQAAKRFAAGQAAAGLISARGAALAEGVLQAMFWTRVKVAAVVVLVLALGGLGTAVLTTQRGVAVQAGAPAPAAEDDPAPGGGGPPADEAQIARNKAQTRINLKQLALAMHNYADDHQGKFPAPAIYGKDGKALLSWRVALLPYLEQHNLYRQFHLDEPWDSPHNRPLADMVPKVYAPPGRPITRPLRTYYQVFVSDAPAGKGPAGGMRGGPGGSAPPAGASGGPTAAGGGSGAPGGAGQWPPGMPGPDQVVGAAFVKHHRLRLPASFPDGTSNIIFIVEAGHPVPWTKPEDLHYAADQPLPELGGLFKDVFHAVFVDGKVHTLTKKYDETNLRAAITRNGGEVQDFAKIEARPRRPVESGDGEELADVGKLRQRNEQLRQQLERARDEIRQLKEERDLQRELGKPAVKKRPPDPRLEPLRREHVRLREQLEQAQEEIQKLRAEIQRLQKPVRKKAP